MKSSACLSPDPAGEQWVCERGAEESVMLGERWCLIVQRPGLSNCDWVHSLLRKGQGQSEKLKSHNQIFLRKQASAVWSGAAWGYVWLGHQPLVLHRHDTSHFTSVPLRSCRFVGRASCRALAVFRCLNEWSISVWLVGKFDGFKSTCLKFFLFSPLHLQFQ